MFVAQKFIFRWNEARLGFHIAEPGVQLCAVVDGVREICCVVGTSSGFLRARYGGTIRRDIATNMKKLKLQRSSADV